MTPVPPDTLLVPGPIPALSEFDLVGGWFLLSVMAIFAVLALVDWRRAKNAGRKWPWDEW